MSEINKIASKHLGRSKSYASEYDPTLLVKIPRILNRKDYGINETTLPFYGYDVWNAYEVSALTLKGLPVNAVAKIVVPCQSECIIESKSLKLYLNSFNLTKLGKSSQDCIIKLHNKIKADIETLLGIDITLSLHQEPNNNENSFPGFVDLNKLTNLDTITFENFNSSKEILKISSMSNTSRAVSFQSNLLRSNCRVTNQPDWGDVFIHLKTHHIPDYTSIAQYLVSHRKINHFHEEVSEMLFVHFLEKYQPQELMIACLYTRRGGIDINPIRATHDRLIPKDFISKNLNPKTLRQ